METTKEVETLINPLLEDRWSPRAFNPDKPIKEAQLEKLFEAARWAPSNYNEQPWHYVYAFNGDDAFDTLVSCLAENNQTWAKDAAVLMVSIARMNYAGKDKKNRHAFHDVGAATMAMSIQATELGLYMHQMGGFDVDKTAKELDLDDNREPVAFIALGYKTDPEKLPEKLQEREKPNRKRKTREEFTTRLKGKDISLPESEFAQE